MSNFAGLVWKANFGHFFGNTLEQKALREKVILLFFRIIDEISLPKKNVPLVDMFDPPGIKIQYKEPHYPYGRCVNLGPALRERKQSIEYFKEHLNVILPFKSKIQWNQPDKK